MFTLYYTILLCTYCRVYILYNMYTWKSPRRRRRAVEHLPKGNLNVTLEKMETDGPRCANAYILYGSRAVRVTLKSVRFYCHELAAAVNYYLRPAAIYPRSQLPTVIWLFRSAYTRYVIWFWEERKRDKRNAYIYARHNNSCIMIL